MGPTRVCGVRGAPLGAIFGVRGGPTRVFGVPMSPVGPIGVPYRAWGGHEWGPPVFVGCGGAPLGPIVPHIGVPGGPTRVFGVSMSPVGPFGVPYRAWGGHEWGPPVFMGCGGAPLGPIVPHIGGPTRVFGAPMSPVGPIGVPYRGCGGHEWGPPVFVGCGAVRLCPILGVRGGSWGSHSSFWGADVTRGSLWGPI